MTLTNKLKKLLETSLIFEEEEKNEWNSLIPQMNAVEMNELYRILIEEVQELKKQGINLLGDSKIESELLPVPEEVVHGTALETLRQQVSKEKPAELVMTPEEITREVSTPELPHYEDLPMVQKAVVPKPAVKAVAPVHVTPHVPADVTSQIRQAVADHKLQTPVVLPKAAFDPARQMKKVTVPSFAKLKPLANLQTTEDLKTIAVAHLRQGELRSQLELIKNKILGIARANKLIPYHTVAAFEQSPLFSVYLQQGNMMMVSGAKTDFAKIKAIMQQQGQDSLSQEEFEALADYRKQIESM